MRDAFLWAMDSLGLLGPQNGEGSVPVARATVSRTLEDKGSLPATCKHLNRKVSKSMGVVVKLGEVVRGESPRRACRPFGKSKGQCRGGGRGE